MYIIFKGISSTFNPQEIVNVRLVRSPSKTIADNPTNVNKQFPSIIVRVTKAYLVKQIMTLYRTLNYYNTRDLDLSLLSSDFASRLPYTKLIINNVLSSTEYKNYISLKSLAVNLGFKYVWHKDGRFLARWRKNNQAHYFNSPTDLHSIKITYTGESHHVISPEIKNPQIEINNSVNNAA